MNIILIPFSLYIYIYYIEDFWNALLCNSKHVKRLYLSYLVISWSFCWMHKIKSKKKETQYEEQKL